MPLEPVKLTSQKITQDAIEACYLKAQDVYENKTNLSEASTFLSRHFGMHLGSARDYLNNFQKMMNGVCYQRTMNGTGTDYFLKKIQENYGSKFLKNALDSVEQHIEYYETFSNGKLRNIRKICEKYRKL